MIKHLFKRTVSLNRDNFGTIAVENVWKSIDLSARCGETAAPLSSPPSAPPSVCGCLS